MDKQTEEFNDVLNMIGSLAPNREEHSPARDALTHFHTPTDTITRRSNMTRKPAIFGAIALVALLIFSAMPATRALASDFLGLFRISKFAPISVSPEQIAVIEELADSGLFPGEFTEIEAPTEPQSFTDFESALAANDALDEPLQFWQMVTVTSLGNPNSIHLRSGGEGMLTIDVDASRQIMEAVGADPALLPDSLDGQNITVDMPTTMVQEWGNVKLVQMQSPEIAYPDGVDPAVIGEAMLQFLGMEEGEASRLSQNIDWTNTMLMPIPTEFASFQEVQIGGTTGMGLESLTDGNSSIMWEAGGMVYMLRAEGESVEALVDMADSLESPMIGVDRSG